jgi:hypothetical protein
MNKVSLHIFLAILFLSMFSYSQDPDAFVDKYFLIVASTKSADDATRIAKNASKKTGLEFHNNSLKADSIYGATYPADSCKKWGEEYPCYFARGRYDAGAYITVEYSTPYDGFEKGYFIVIAVNGSLEDEEFKLAVKKVKKVYPKSYVKKSKVYLGCMH